MIDPIPILTLLAKLYEEQSAASREEAQNTYADFYAGAASACRVALLMLVPTDVVKKGGGKGGGKKYAPATDSPPPDAITNAVAFPAYQPPIKVGKKLRCPECGKEYDLPQHVGAHRKRAHGVPSVKDRNG